MSSATAEGFTTKNIKITTDYFDTSKVFLAERQVGGALCRLIVVDSSDLKYNELKSVMNFMGQLANVHQRHFSTIYLVFVFVAESLSDDIFEIIASGEPFERQDIYNIYWGASLSDFTVHTNKEQPSEMFRIRECVDSCLSEMKIADNVIYWGDYDTSAASDGLNVSTLKESRLKIKSDNASSSFTLIAINFAILMFMLFFDLTHHFWLEGAVIPEAIWGNNEYYRLLTAMFIHANAMHFVSNGLGIYIFGTRIEKYFGKPNFFVIYFGSGLLASFFSLLFTRGISAGASGAVYGLIGAAAVKSYLSRRELDGISAYLIVIWIAVGFIMSSVMTGVDAFGHLGGLLGGLVLGYVLGRERK